MKHTLLFTTLTITVLITAGCGNAIADDIFEETVDGNTITLPVDVGGTVPPEKQAGEPSIAIITPEQDDVLNNPVIVEVAIQNFRLSEEVDGENSYHVGHWELKANGEQVNISTGNTLQVELEPGEYTLQARLKNNDRTDLEERIISNEVIITIE